MLRVNNKLLNLILSLYIIFAILNYTELSNNIIQIAKIFFQSFFILFCVKNININQFKLISPLIFLEFIIPLVFIFLTIYNFSIQQTLAYIFYFIFTLIFYMSVIKIYSRKILNFFKLILVNTDICFFGLWVFYRDIDLSIISHIRNIIQRSDINRISFNQFLLNQRNSLGFIDPNTLALVSTIMISCAIFIIFKTKKNISLLILNVIVGLIFILNSESRASIIVILITMLVIIIEYLAKYNKKISYLILFGIDLYNIIYAYFVLFNNKNSNLFYLLNNISSGRLYFSRNVIQWVNGHYWFGIGPLNTTYLQKITGTVLDNSLTYYISTIGIFGMIVLYFWLTWMGSEFIKYQRYSLFLFYIYIMLYSLFENTLFLPNSFSSFFSSVILIYGIFSIKGKKNEIIGYNNSHL